MSIIMGALAGAGEALANVGARNQQADLTRENELAVGKQRNDLETQRQQTMAVFQENMRNAPLNRLGAKAKDLAGQDVPVEAAPVTTLSGQDPKLAENTGGMEGVTKGMVGNYADLVAKAKDLPVEDRQPYLDQLKRQFSADTETAKTSIIGQVRRRTSDEAMNAAAEDAKVNDPVAYAAYQREIGKPLRDERRVDNQEKRLDQQDATTNRRLDLQQEFNEQRAKHQDRLAEIQEQRATRQEGRQGDLADKAETQATRQALTSVLKDIGTQEDKIQMKMMDPMLTPEQKAVLEGQFKTLDRDRVNARNELMKLAGVEPRAADAAPAKNGWDSGSGQVYKNGEVIGTAKTEQEGRALYQGGSAATAAKKAPAVEPAKPAYVPPADSPAGRAAANREKANASAAQKSSEELQAASDIANQALANKDPEAAQRAQSAPGFSRLDTATKAAIFKLVNGR